MKHTYMVIGLLLMRLDVVIFVCRYRVAVVIPRDINNGFKITYSRMPYNAVQYNMILYITAVIGAEYEREFQP